MAPTEQSKQCEVPATVHDNPLFLELHGWMSMHNMHDRRRTKRTLRLKLIITRKSGANRKQQQTHFHGDDGDDGDDGDEFLLPCPVASK